MVRLVFMIASNGKRRRVKMRTIQEVFNALVKADFDTELIEIFDEDNVILVKINNVDTTEEGLKRWILDDE